MQAQSSAAQQLREEPQESDFVEQADRCRRLARATHDRGAADILERMAADYDQQARRGS